MKFILFLEQNHSVTFFRTKTHFRLTALFAFFLAWQFSLAQAPGYMGKTFNAGYGFNVSPAFAGATPNGSYLNMIHEFYIDKALDSRWQIGVSARLYRTVYDNRVELTKISTRPSDEYRINGFTLALNFKHYRSRYVAPWGKYFMMSPVVNFVRTSYDPYMHVPGEINGHDTLYADFGEPTQSYYHPDFMLGWGRTRVIADKLIIDYGWNFQLLSTFALITDAFKATNTYFTYENYISETHSMRVHGVNRFNVFVKLGYLF